MRLLTLLECKNSRTLSNHQTVWFVCTVPDHPGGKLGLWIVWPPGPPWAAELDRVQRRPGAEPCPEARRPGAEEDRRREVPLSGGHSTSMKVFLTITMACIAAERHGTKSFAKGPRNGLASRNGYGCDNVLSGCVWESGESDATFASGCPPEWV